MRLLLSATLAMLTSIPVSAYAYCSEPSAPYCATRYGSFDDQWDFDRCKREMESYQSEIEEFMGCNNREARSKNDQASSEYSDTIDSFNRRARN